MSSLKGSYGSNCMPEKNKNLPNNLSQKSLVSRFSQKCVRHLDQEQLILFLIFHNPIEFDVIYCFDWRNTFTPVSLRAKSER